MDSHKDQKRIADEGLARVLKGFPGATVRVEGNGQKLFIPYKTSQGLADSFVLDYDPSTRTAILNRKSLEREDTTSYTLIRQLEAAFRVNGFSVSLDYK